MQILKLQKLPEFKTN